LDLQRTSAHPASTVEVFAQGEFEGLAGVEELVLGMDASAAFFIGGKKLA